MKKILHFETVPSTRTIFRTPEEQQTIESVPMDTLVNEVQEWARLAELWRNTPQPKRPTLPTDEQTMLEYRTKSYERMAIGKEMTSQGRVVTDMIEEKYGIEIKPTSEGRFRSTTKIEEVTQNRIILKVDFIPRAGQEDTSPESIRYILTGKDYNIQKLR